MGKHRRTFIRLIILLFIMIVGITGCSSRQNASLNNRMKLKPSVTVGVKENKTVDNTSNTADNNEQSEEANDQEYQSFMDSKSQNITPTKEAAKINSDQKDYGAADASGRVGYHCDIEKDKKAFSGTADIIVGDKFYATQINDWYTNFDQYEGKTVEIEGYYIDDNAPYTFVGRYGPSCPYCNGGYVSFEFYTKEDLSDLKTAEDWIKVTGILRQGEDSSGIFYYIEVLSLEKMKTVGKDTVSD